jgi:hypothetical protein
MSAGVLRPWHAKARGQVFHRKGAGSKARGQVFHRTTIRSPCSGDATCTRCIAGSPFEPQREIGDVLRYPRRDMAVAVQGSPRRAEREAVPPLADGMMPPTVATVLHVASALVGGRNGGSPCGHPPYGIHPTTSVRRQAFHGVRVRQSRKRQEKRKRGKRGQAQL